MTSSGKTSHDVVEDWIFFGAIPLHFVLFVALLVSLSFTHERRAGPGVQVGEVPSATPAPGTSSRDGFLGSEPIWSTGGVVRFER